MNKIYIVFVFSFLLLLTSCKKDKPTIDEVKTAIINNLIDSDKTPGKLTQEDREKAFKEMYDTYRVYKLICKKHENKKENWRCAAETGFEGDEPAYLGLIFHRDENGDLDLMSVKGF